MPVNGFWLSLNVPNTMIMYEFVKNKIKLNGYAFCYPPLKSIPRIKSWIIRGSNDKIEWSIIDEVRLEDPKKKQWEVYHVISLQSFRYFQIMLTEPNFAGVYQIAISEVEFFGDIV